MLSCSTWLVHIGIRLFVGPTCLIIVLFFSLSCVPVWSIAMHLAPFLLQDNPYESQKTLETTLGFQLNLSCIMVRARRISSTFKAFHISQLILKTSILNDTLLVHWMSKSHGHQTRWCNKLKYLVCILVILWEEVLLIYCILPTGESFFSTQNAKI